MLTESNIKTALAQEIFGHVLCESLHQKYIVDYFYDKLLLEKSLVGEPMTVPELRKLLHQKIVNFEFIKLNGNVRPARGTTMMDKIPDSDHPKGIRPSSQKVATFWDMSKKAWRSVSSRSKEIVLKKDTDDSAVVTVRDVKDKTPNEVIVKKKEEPIKKEPELKEKPDKEEPIKKEVPIKEPEKKEEPIKKEVPIKQSEPEKKEEPIVKQEPKQTVEPVVQNPAQQPIIKQPGEEEPEIKTFAPEKDEEIKK